MYRQTTPSKKESFFSAIPTTAGIVTAQTWPKATISYPQNDITLRWRRRSPLGTQWRGFSWIWRHMTLACTSWRLFQRSVSILFSFFLSVHCHSKKRISRISIFYVTHSGERDREREIRAEKHPYVLKRDPSVIFLCQERKWQDVAQNYKKKVRAK